MQRVGPTICKCLWGWYVNRLEAYRHFYAELVTTSAGAAKNERLKHAFASTPRERFIGIGPWKVFARGNYVETPRSEEHTSELQSLTNLVCRLLLEKKKKQKT